MTSKYPEYSGFLEGRRRNSGPRAQPNGVSEADKKKNEGWGHRTQIEEVDTPHRRSVSQRVNERQAGEVVTLGKKDHGKEGHKARNANDDALVDEGKSIARKYADRYGSDDDS